MLGRVTTAPAPDWTVSSWFNSGPMTLRGLRGRVVVLEVFQMLCPGCVSHSLPQATRLNRVLPPGDVTVIGLHSVFENHAAMTPSHLGTFLRDSRIDFPVAVDAHRWDGEVDSPVTFDDYRMTGTPTTILIDRSGTIRFHEFGRLDDATVTTPIHRLVAEPRTDTRLR